MRYAIISDIHSNLEALHAVCGELARERIDRYVVLGDLVGYGADPAAAVRTVKELRPFISIAGNHDWGVLGLAKLDYFNDNARWAVEWTRAVIGEEERAYLRGLPLIATHDAMTAVHGSLEDPAGFEYVRNADDAFSCLERSKTGIVLVGHSHVAGVFRGRRKGIERVGEATVAVEDGARYLVNAGSVGQPRDGDPRAAYVIMDDEKRTIDVRRVGYDMRKAQGKIREAGLPAFLADRLAEGI